MRQHVRPGHVESVLRAALEVKAGAARTRADVDARNRTVVVRVALLEHVDGPGAGGVDSLALGVEPEVVDAENAGEGGDDRAPIACPRPSRRPGCSAAVNSR